MKKSSSCYEDNDDVYDYNKNILIMMIKRTNKMFTNINRMFICIN